jgi:site-specific DNA recombinase
MLRAVTYARVSSDGQRERETIESQRVELRAFVAQHDDWKVIEAIEDDGLSGETIDGRPGFLRVLALAKAKAFDVLVISKLDRLTRSSNQVEAAHIGRTLKLAGVRLAMPGISGLLDLANPTEDLMSSMLMLFASFDKSQILRNTYGGRATKVKSNDGKNSGFVPFGYRWVPFEDGRGKRGRYELIASEAAIIRTMVAMCLDGLGAVAIRDQLEARKLWARKHGNNKTGLWTEINIKRILKSTTIKGEMRALGGKHFIPVPAVIDDETWRRVQNAFASRTRARQPSADRTDALLAGRLVCGVCGYAYCLDNGRANRYYRCASRGNWRAFRLEGHCGNTIFRTAFIDELVWSELVKVLSSREMLLRCASLQRSHVQAGVDFREDLAKWTRRLETLEELVEEVLGRRRRDLISQQACDKECARIASERKMLERQVEVAKDQIAQTGDTVEWLGHIDALAKSLAGTFERLTFADRLLVVETYLPKSERCRVEVFADGACKVHGILTKDTLGRALPFTFLAEKQTA